MRKGCACPSSPVDTLSKTEAEVGAGYGMLHRGFSSKKTNILIGMMTLKLIETQDCCRQFTHYALSTRVMVGIENARADSVSALHSDVSR